VIFVKTLLLNASKSLSVGMVRFKVLPGNLAIEVGTFLVKLSNLLNTSYSKSFKDVNF